MVEAACQAQGKGAGRFRFEREVGQHVAHQGLLGQRLAEGGAAARMVQRMAERGAHDAGAAQHAIEPGMAAHFEDGRDAAPDRPHQPADGVAEFDFGGGVRAVAKLVLQALHPDRVAAAVGQVARHQEAGQAGGRVAGLRQDQVGIRLRRRKEPFMADDAPGALSRFAESRQGLAWGHFAGAGRVRAHVAAALLFRHAHADQGAALLIDRERTGIVVIGEDFRQPALSKGAGAAQSGHAGIGHRHRALGAVFDLAEQQISAGARDLGARARVEPGSGMGAGADQHAHQFMPGRMEFDFVDALTGTIEGMQTRPVRVRQARQVKHLGAAELRAQFIEPLYCPPGAFAHQPLAQGGIAAQQVDVFKGRRLVEHRMRVKRIHAISCPARQCCKKASIWTDSLSRMQLFGDNSGIVHTSPVSDASTG